MLRSLQSCPLRRPTLRLSRALIRIHCRLRGKTLKIQRAIQPQIQPEAPHAAMAHIKTVLKFIGVDFDPAAIKAVTVRPAATTDGHPLGMATRELARDLLRLHMRLKGEL